MMSKQNHRFVFGLCSRRPRMLGRVIGESQHACNWQLRESESIQSTGRTIWPIVPTEKEADYHHQRKREGGGE